MAFHRILVPITPGGGDDPALQAAVTLARRENASLTLFDVAEDASWAMQFLTSGWEQAIEDISGAKHKLLQHQAETLSAGGIRADHLLSKGKLSVAIVQEVLTGGYDLVLKMAEGCGANRSGILGSTDVRLLRKCPCPVLILRSTDQTEFQRVAVALDVLDTHVIQRDLDEKVIAAAKSLGDGHLDLIYAIPPLQDCVNVDADDTDMVTPEVLANWQAELSTAAHQKLKELKAQFGETATELHVLDGAPEEAVPEFVTAHDVDLLVMGTVARSGMDGLLIGNTAERILSQVECSILALKPDSFISPIGRSAYSESES